MVVPRGEGRLSLSVTVSASDGHSAPGASGEMGCQGGFPFPSLPVASAAQPCPDGSLYRETGQQGMGFFRV